VVYLIFACDDDVVDVGEYILANLVFKYGLSEAGECGLNILEPFEHPHEIVGVSKGVINMAFVLSSSLRYIWW
jgi:hypothetical protein